MTEKELALTEKELRRVWLSTPPSVAADMAALISEVRRLQAAASVKAPDADQTPADADWLADEYGIHPGPQSVVGDYETLRVTAWAKSPVLGSRVGCRKSALSGWTRDEVRTLFRLLGVSPKGDR